MNDVSIDSFRSNRKDDIENDLKDRLILSYEPSMNNMSNI